MQAEQKDFKERREIDDGVSERGNRLEIYNCEISGTG